MVCEWLKNGQGQWKRTRFYLSWNYSCTLYLSVKIKLKNPLTSAYLNLNYGTKKKTKNVKVTKVVEFIKTCDHYPRKFNFGHFFHFHNPTTPILLGEKYKKPCSREMVHFPLPSVVMITTG